MTRKTLKGSDKLAHARILAGLTQQALGELADVSPQMIQAVEAGTRNCRPAVATRIARALGLTLAEAVADGCFTIQDTDHASI